MRRGGSDHTIVAVKVAMEVEKVTRKETDWDKVRQWLDKQEENPDNEARWEFIVDPYRELGRLSKSWERICGRSKKGMETTEEEVQGNKEGISQGNQEGQERDPVG